MRLIGTAARTRTHGVLAAAADKTLDWGDADSSLRAWASDLVITVIIAVDAVMCAALGHAPIAGTCVLCGRDI